MHLLLTWALVLLVAGKAGAIQPNENCRGDFNSDGRVDFSDFVMFAGVFGAESGQETYNARGDFDGNGRVDFTDFVAFAGVFGMECPEVSPDREALIALYNASDGPSWRNWLSDRPLGEWYGVTTNDSGRVVVLNLPRPGNPDATKLTDISALDSLTALTRLNLLRHAITDISVLAGLTRLEHLNLAQNTISDISALAELTALTSLELQGNTITDISALSGLTALTRLDLSKNTITDISALSGLTRLEYLNLSQNTISDISALAGLTALTSLDLQDNPLNLAALINLSVLTGRGVEVTPVPRLDDRTLLVALYNANGWDDGSIETHWLSDKPLWRWSGVDTEYERGEYRVVGLELLFKNITDISALAGLTRLETLNLAHNKITDISALVGLTRLERLRLQDNPLNAAALTDHLHALTGRGVNVRFDVPRNGDFDIELVFLDHAFTEWHRRVLQYAARHWMSMITEDEPDVVFSQNQVLSCGNDSYRIAAGERIDDLRIYVNAFPFPGDYSYRTLGLGGLSLTRQETRLPVVGCMGFRLSRLNDPAEFSEVALHEIGHALGFGNIWDGHGLLEDPDTDPHFSGPLAIAAFDAAGGRGYSGAKVPVASDKAHWKLPVLAGELMGPIGGDRGEDGGALSAITIQSLADLGYGVDLTYAHAYTLPGAIPAAKIDAAAHVCGAGLHPEPIDVVDAEGRILER